MTISTDDVHDVKAFPVLLEEAGKRRRIKRCLGDGAYDSGEVYDSLEAQGIEAVIKRVFGSGHVLVTSLPRVRVKLVFACLCFNLVQLDRLLGG